MSTKKSKYLNISIGGKLGDEERRWIESEAKSRRMTATFVVLDAVRAAMKKGLTVKA